MSTSITISPGSHFSLANLPFGVFSAASTKEPHIGIAIGDHVLDLHSLASRHFFSQRADVVVNLQDEETLLDHNLNRFARLGRAKQSSVRQLVQSLLHSSLQNRNTCLIDPELLRSSLHSLASVKMHLPMAIGDYTDFYAGIHHATNVGTLFRGKDNALQPNYLHLPVGYHGRASSIVTSGTPIRRPHGQILANSNTDKPSLAASQKLDIELELAVFITRSNELGSPIPMSEADDFIFGYVMMNDWSARDIQAFEYVPLGPFTSKNFATTISPWIILAEVLEPFLVDSQFHSFTANLLPYLKPHKPSFLDMTLDVMLKRYRTYTKLFSSNTKYLVFSFPQMIAHHTITGCPLQTGDLLGSGTISGPDKQSFGSFLEASSNGRIPYYFYSGDTQLARSFLEDGDEVNITGFVINEYGEHIGFGDCSGVILPALALTIPAGE